MLLFAHRGARNIAPENTLKAFQKAIELKADGIEFDVRGSKDKEVVIMHDNCTLRTTHKWGHIDNMNIEKIKLLNAGQGEKVPTLQELITIVKDKVILMCELKVHGISEKVTEMLRTADLINSSIIISFKHDELLKIKRMEPKLKVGSIIPSSRGWFTNWFAKKKVVRFASEHEFYSINPYYPLITQKLVAFAHKHGLKVFPWTVNSALMIKKCMKMGVDGILTDNIVKVKQILKKVF